MKITKKQIRKIINENVGFSPMRSRAHPHIVQAVENSRQKERLNEAFTVSSLLGRAADALDIADAAGLEQIASELDGALMDERELDTLRQLFDSMINAAYTIEEAGLDDSGEF